MKALLFVILILSCSSDFTQRFLIITRTGYNKIIAQITKRGTNDNSVCGYPMDKFSTEKDNNIIKIGDDTVDKDGSFALRLTKKKLKDRNYKAVDVENFYNTAYSRKFLSHIDHIKVCQFSYFDEINALETGKTSQLIQRNEDGTLSCKPMFHLSNNVNDPTLITENQLETNMVILNQGAADNQATKISDPNVSINEFVIDKLDDEGFVCLKTTRALNLNNFKWKYYYNGSFKVKNADVLRKDPIFMFLIPKGWYYKTRSDKAKHSLNLREDFGEYFKNVLKKITGPKKDNIYDRNAATYKWRNYFIRSLRHFLVKKLEIYAEESTGVDILKLIKSLEPVPNGSRMLDLVDENEHAEVISVADTDLIGEEKLTKRLRV